MKTSIVCLIFVLLSLSVSATSQPKATPKAKIKCGKMRFTILTPQLVRIEWNKKAKFQDQASLTVINRKLDVPSYSVKKTKGYIYIHTDSLDIVYRQKTYPDCAKNLHINLRLNGQQVVWYPGKKDSLNLLGTTRTLDGLNGYSFIDRMEPGLLSRSGWTLVDDSKTPLLNSDADIPWVNERPDSTAIDWYFWGYGHNYRKAIYDFTRISGRVPMPPRFVFGYWYSRYAIYSDQDFRNIVSDMQHYDVPCDVMIMDMNWHNTYSLSGRNKSSEGWTGYTWNKNLFPDPKKFIEFLHLNHLKTALNLHPASGIYHKESMFKAFAKDIHADTLKDIPWNLDNKDFYRAYAKEILHPNQQIGVDFWWLDWQQTLLSKYTKNLSNTFWLNHIFYHDMNNYTSKRPLIFHRWGGLGNHRYQIGFSGDTHATFNSLDFEPYFTATAANVCYGYWSHDIGGHGQEGPNDPEMYLRWIQFGVFSPILRTHASKDGHVERRIWKYPNFPQLNEALHLRYSLVPYIYSMAHKTYLDGVAICHPLYYDYPETEYAYRFKNEYMFGDDIIVRPVTSRVDTRTGLATVKLWLPRGKWFEAATGTMLEGDRVYTRSFTLNEIPYYFKAGAVIPSYPKLSNLDKEPQRLIIRFAPGSKGRFSYYEDNGTDKGYFHGQYATTLLTQNEADSSTMTYTVDKRIGRFDSMLSARAYTFRLLATLPPKQVIVNGKNYFYSAVPHDGTWSYDARKLAVVVSIPETDCDQKITCQVKFPYSRQKMIKMLNGKTGQLSRMQFAASAIRDEFAKMDCCEAPPENFLHLAGTVSRIGYRPETVVKEVHFFDQHLIPVFDSLLTDPDLNKPLLESLKASLLNKALPKKILKDGTYSIESIENNGYLSVKDDRLLVEKSACHWALKLAVNGWYYIRSVDGRYLTMDKKQNGAKPYLSTLSNTDNQLWKIQQVDGKQSYYLIPARSLKLLEIDPKVFDQTKQQRNKGEKRLYVDQGDNSDGDRDYQQWILKP